MTKISERLNALHDEPYAAFEAKLVPTVSRERCLGVRVPKLRKLAQELAHEPQTADFLAALPHAYYDEDMLHAILLSKEKDFDAAIAAVDRFLPYVDNWAVCDTLRPKAFERNRDALLPHIRRWAASDAPFVCRFGLEMLLTHFLEEAFAPDLFAIPLAVTGEDYYVRMMLAWFYATALSKQWDATVPLLQNNALPTWVHNKTIQKARESFRIRPEQKAYLLTLKRSSAE